MNYLQDYIPMQEAVKELGYASSSTLSLWAREKKIPGAMKVGNCWLLPREWVDDKKKEGLPSGKAWKRGVSARN